VCVCDICDAEASNMRHYVQMQESYYVCLHYVMYGCVKWYLSLMRSTLIVYVCVCVCAGVVYVIERPQI